MVTVEEKNADGGKKSGIPFWIKASAPTVIVAAVVTGGLIYSGIIDLGGKPNADITDEPSVDVPETSDEAVPDPITSIDGTVMHLNGHSYMLFGDCYSWEEAEENCESMGGHLAVIGSQEENDAVYAFVRYQGADNAFIGLSDSISEGDWVWVTGEDIEDYTNWNEVEPNAYTDDEDYVFIAYNGRWNDGEYAPDYENGLIIYVCEWDYEVTGSKNMDGSNIIADVE